MQVAVTAAAAGVGLVFLACAAVEEVALCRVLYEWRREAATRMPSLSCLLGEEHRHGRQGLAALPGIECTHLNLQLPRFWILTNFHMRAVQQRLEEGGRLPSILAFSWVSPLMKRGAQRQLQFADLFQLQPDMQPASCHSHVWEAWSNVRPTVLVNDGLGDLDAQLMCSACRSGSRRMPKLRSRAACTRRSCSVRWPGSTAAATCCWASSSLARTCSPLQVRTFICLLTCRDVL